MAINLLVEIAFMAINLPVEIQHSHRRLTAAGRAVVNRTAHFKSLSLRLPAKRFFSQAQVDALLAC